MASRKSLGRNTALWLLAPRLAVLGLPLSVLGCEDPLRQDAIADLGEETPGIPQGPLHRAGQPCLSCHDGTEATELAVAGTAYKLADAKDPAVGALVHLIDASGATHIASTNCAGNFFIRPGDYRPIYPMWVKVEVAGWLQEMESPVNGQGSCAACHAAEPGPSSAGRVYLFPFDVNLEEIGCQ